MRKDESKRENLTPYDVLRLENYKSFKVRHTEMYPSIRPPVSQCDNAKSGALLVSTMEANGCGPVDPSLLDKRQKPSIVEDSSTRVKSKAVREPYPCRDKKRTLHNQLLQHPELTAEMIKLSPYDMMRKYNCKTYDNQRTEIYPNVRPPISRCSDTETAKYLIDSFEDNCCKRPFNMEQDDVLDLWKQSPHKQTLAYYGIVTDKRRPEAVGFNEVISKCLEKVSRPKPKKQETPPSTTSRPRNIHGPCDDLVLNRSMLTSKMLKMPMVRKKLSAKNAFTWIHCAKRKLGEKPFAETRSVISLKAALDMEKVKGIPRQGLRRKHPYCDSECGISKNDCTTYEWMKYQQDPRRVRNTFKRQLKEVTEEPQAEPKNYEELYEELMTCFGVDKQIDPLCYCYKKCCRETKSYKDAPDGAGHGAGHPGGQGHIIIKEPPLGDKSDPDNEKTEDKEEDKIVDPDKPDSTRPEDNKMGPDDQADKPGQTKPDKTKPGKGGGAADKPNKDKPIKDKPQKEKPNKIKPGKEKPEPDKPPQKPLGDISDSGYRPDDDSDIRKSSTPSGGEHNLNEQPTPEKPNGDKPEEPEIDESIDQPQSEKPHKGTDKPKKPGKPGHDIDKSKHKPSPKPKPDKVKPSKPLEDQKPAEIPKDCPCEICEFMKHGKQPDSQFITKMKRDEKRRKLREYYKEMCRRQNFKCLEREYRAPLHKCDGIVCDNCFCHNPKLGEYCECLDAMQQLQKLLGPQHKIVKNELIFNIQDLRNRICNRFCECL